MKCSSGAPEAGSLVNIAMLLAMKSFNFKIFDDWVVAHMTLDPCTGIIEAGKKYILPALQYTTEYHFQICETCFRLMFEPHTITRQSFRETVSSTRSVCSINRSSIQGYAETLLKATWKQDSNQLLEYAKLQAPIPPCPGSVNATPMRLWYASQTQFEGQVESVTCCEACFHEFIRPSKLYASFERFANPPAQESNTCLMSMPEVRDLYSKACAAGQISTFHSSLLEFAQRVCSYD
jgi:hypothetical protein